MRRNNLLPLFHRAFTLVELIIVIVIVGLLAAISIVGYSAVVDRSEQAAAETTLQSVDREYRALDAFNAGTGVNGVDLDSMSSVPSVEFNDTDGDGVLETGETAVYEKDGVVSTLVFNSATTAGDISTSAADGGSSESADPVASAFNAGLSFDGTYLQPSLETPSLEALGAGVTAFEVQCRVVENGEPHTSGSFKLFPTNPSTVYDGPEDFVKYNFYLRIRSNWGYKTEGTGIACSPSNSGDARYYMANVESGDRIEIEWQARTFNGVEWSNWSTTFSSGEVLIP